MKNYIIIAVFLAVVIGLPNFASAQSLISSQILEEIQAQIKIILNKVVELEKQVAAIYSATTTPVSISTTTPSVSITEFCYTFRKDITDKNITAAEIKKLHEILEREGIEISDEEKTNAIIGDSTRSAISSFQEKYIEEILSPLNLQESTGILGKQTIKKINELYGCKKDTVSAKKYNENRIIVKFKEQTAQAKIDDIIAKHIG